MFTKVITLYTQSSPDQHELYLVSVCSYGTRNSWMLLISCFPTMMTSSSWASSMRHPPAPHCSTDTNTDLHCAFHLNDFTQNFSRGRQIKKLKWFYYFSFLRFTYNLMFPGASQSVKLYFHHHHQNLHQCRHDSRLHYELQTEYCSFQGNQWTWGDTNKQLVKHIWCIFSLFCGSCCCRSHRNHFANILIYSPAGGAVLL